MAIDASIPLQAQPPQNPLEQYGRVLALQNALGQQQQQQQQIKSGQIDLQQKQQDQQDQQIFRQGLEQTNGDWEKTISLVTGKVSPKFTMALENQLLDHKTKLESYDKTKLENNAKKDEYVANGLNTITNADPQQQPTLYAQFRDSALRDGMAKPTDIPEQFDPNWVLLHKALSTPVNQQNNAALTAAARKKTADTGQEKLDAEKPGLEAKSAQEVRGDLAAKLGAATTPAEYQKILGAAPFQIAREFDGKTPEQARQLGMTAEQQAQAAQAKTNADRTAQHDKIIEGVAQGHLSIAEADLRLKQDQAGFDQNGGVSPTAKLAAEGKMDPQTLRAIIRRNPGVIAQIQKIDPNFDEANIDNRYNTLKEFTSTSNGKAGGQALALNTLIHHADLYLQTAQALKNGTFTPGNAVYNAVAQAFGSAPPTNAALVGRFFAGETGKVATGGVPAEGEINGILKNLGTNASPDQISGAAKTLLQIAAGRATPLMERVDKAKLGNVVQVLGPDAKQILQRNGFDPNTMKATASGVAPIALKDGTTLTPHDAAAADKFRKEHPELLK